MAYVASKSQNPFYSGDDEQENVDDFTFLNHPKQGTGYMLENEREKPLSDAERQRQIFVQRKRELEESTLRSTKSSLMMIDESEQMAMATAEELVRQREQLQRAEDNLDDINSNLTVSQKHLNSIKSVFGGLKNWWGQKSKDTVRSTSGDGRPVVPSSTLSAAMERCNIESPVLQNDDNHPAFRARGMFQEDMDSANTSSSLSKQIDAKIDRNLDDLSVGIGKLKHIALGLGDEIDEQDELLSRLDAKVETADGRIYVQNRDMARILKK